MRSDALQAWLIWPYRSKGPCR